VDGTFQIAVKAEPSRNRQRGAVDESRGTKRGVRDEMNRDSGGGVRPGGGGAEGAMVTQAIPSNSSPGL